MKYASTLFTEASGKVGNIVASKGKSGSYFRSKVKPANPKTQAQSDVRAQFSTISKLYRGLTDDQRSGWAALGAATTEKNTLGQSFTLTGSQSHSSLNGVILSGGGAPISNAPGAPDILPAFPTILLTALRDIAPNSFVLSVNTNGAYMGKVQVYATPAVSAGRNSFGASAFRLLEVLPDLADGGNAITAAYVAKFGTPAVGTKIAVKLVPVSANGFKGGKYHAVSIVSAL